jgi:hypothetical protein
MAPLMKRQKVTDEITVVTVDCLIVSTVPDDLATIKSRVARVVRISLCECAFNEVTGN